ncbi:MAG TPA: HEAT repeat domain-containing protein, partial [Polyangiaceae bacterium]
EAAYQLARLGLRETHELALRWQNAEADSPLHEAATRILALEAERGTGAASELGRPGPDAARDTAASEPLRLALSPSAQADAELERAIAKLLPGFARRQMIRAAVTRRWALGRTVSGLEQALHTLESASDPSDRAVFAWASALSDPDHVERLVARASPGELRAIARAARIPQVALALAERLERTSDPLTRSALAACLAFEPTSERVATDTLLSLLADGGIAAPLAARALAARDSANLRPRIEALIADDDPLLRAHALLGLGQSEDPTALGLLAGAYRFESDETVRLAIVRALSQRPERARRRTLELAAELDASPPVRQAARLALTGQKLGAFVTGRASAWLDFGRDGSAGSALALVAGPDGLALPAVADPDGVLIETGLEIGPFTLRVAPPAPNDKAPSPAP